MHNTGVSIHVKGMSRTPFYRCWVNLRHRCMRPTHTQYKHYGARCITVCSDWMVFDNFYADMYEGYLKNLVLDRKDNNKGYFKENCHWVTQKQNCRNKRGNRMIDAPEGNMTLAEACEKYNINPALVRYRLNRGYTSQQALITPVRGKHK